MKGLVCGWGVNDADYQIQVRKPYWAEGKKKYKSTFNCPYYRTWLRMLERCHAETYHLSHPSYRGTSVCEDWKYFMSFRSWMVRQPWYGNVLDKDIIGDGTLYSPDTCCFVPRSVNMFWNKTGDRGRGLVGASFHNASGRFRAQCKIDDQNVALGYFNTELEAHRAWVAAKEKAMTILLSRLSLEPRVVEGMHRKLKQFQARLAA